LSEASIAEVEGLLLLSLRLAAWIYTRVVYSSAA